MQNEAFSSHFIKFSGNTASVTVHKLHVEIELSLSELHRGLRGGLRHQRLWLQGHRHERYDQIE